MGEASAQGVSGETYIFLCIACDQHMQLLILSVIIFWISGSPLFHRALAPDGDLGVGLLLHPLLGVASWANDQPDEVIGGELLLGNVDLSILLGWPAQDTENLNTPVVRVYFLQDKIARDAYCKPPLGDGQHRSSATWGRVEDLVHCLDWCANCSKLIPAAIALQRSSLHCATGLSMQSPASWSLEMFGRACSLLAVCILDLP